MLPRIAAACAPEGLARRGAHGMIGRMTTDIAQLLRAASFAAHKHRDQRRKDAQASPYINHPLALACILANEGGVTDTATLCAALLHDTIEDTDTTAEEIVREFGAEIAGIVKEVTDDKALPTSERKRLQIEHAAHISVRAKRVKLADKIANLRDVAASPPATWSLERRREYFDWAKSVIDGLRGVDARLEGAFDQAFAARP
jgi:GTP diphosphokinase / guanosine-3',5'-bis(diphosphate) 3'-diphosphatase